MSVEREGLKSWLMIAKEQVRPAIYPILLQVSLSTLYGILRFSACNLSA
jgi:hypothetical protein